MEPLENVVSLIGSQAKLAQVIGVTPMAVSAWKRRGQVPASRVFAIEKATNFKVSRHDLRPDLYPREDWCQCPACRRERGEAA
ncbi:MAG TPA: helix-turn-helix domain-containing protein [Gammaproteobacteria bacterium]|nr:helix-turn-helix domain-containing protein [Gammaproteobacteria bacterium]